MKRPLFLLAFPLLGMALTACSANQSYAGLYTFQMGKTSSTHFGISMLLEDTAYITSASSGEEPVEKGKEFTLKFDATMADGSDGVMSELAKLFPDGINLDGYYRIGDPVEKGNILSIGFALTDLLTPEVIESAIGMSLELDVVEHFIYSEINSTTITLKIPVSMPDLQFQLYWYGFDIYFTDKGTDSEEAHIREVENHPAGSHPTKEEIAEINKTYETDHKSTYRDYHTITLGLTKQ